jgi:hypothetical protein
VPSRSRPKGDDFLSVPSDDQAKLDKMIKDNKKVICFHERYAAKVRKKEPANAGPSKETQPATGEEGE